MARVWVYIWPSTKEGVLNFTSSMASKHPMLAVLDVDGASFNGIVRRAKTKFKDATSMAKACATLVGLLDEGLLSKPQRLAALYVLSSAASASSARGPFAPVLVNAFDTRASEGHDCIECKFTHMLLSSSGEAQKSLGTTGPKEFIMARTGSTAAVCHCWGLADLDASVRGDIPAPARPAPPAPLTDAPPTLHVSGSAPASPMPSSSPLARFPPGSPVGAVLRSHGGDGLPVRRRSLVLALTADNGDGDGDDAGFSTFSVAPAFELSFDSDLASPRGQQGKGGGDAGSARNSSSLGGLGGSDLGLAGMSLGDAAADLGLGLAPIVDPLQSLLLDPREATAGAGGTRPGEGPPGLLPPAPPPPPLVSERLRLLLRQFTSDDDSVSQLLDTVRKGQQQAQTQQQWGGGPGSPRAQQAEGLSGPVVRDLAGVPRMPSFGAAAVAPALSGAALILQSLLLREASGSPLPPTQAEQLARLLAESPGAPLELPELAAPPQPLLAQLAEAAPGVAVAVLRAMLAAAPPRHWAVASSPSSEGGGAGLLQALLDVPASLATMEVVNQLVVGECAKGCLVGLWDFALGTTAELPILTYPLIHCRCLSTPSLRPCSLRATSAGLPTVVRDARAGHVRGGPRAVQPLPADAPGAPGVRLPGLAGAPQGGGGGSAVGGGAGLLPAVLRRQGGRRAL